MIIGHGDDAYLYDQSIEANFSSNVYPLGQPEGLKDYLFSVWDTVTQYPEAKAQSLQKALEQYHNTNCNTVLVCNGATEAFYLVAQFLKQTTATIVVPAFAEYQDACTTHNINCSFTPWDTLTQNHIFTTQAVFLGNPNNPTGFVLSPEIIENWLYNNPTTYFVIDEAYADFTIQNTTLIDKTEQYKNLIIIRSLTKKFAIPGLRLGYIVSHCQNIIAIEQFKMPWSVNTLAIAAGHYCLLHDKPLPLTTLLKDTQDLSKELNNINGITVFKSSTTFILCKLENKSAVNLKNYLINKHQILIREASNFKTLDKHYFRIASQGKNKNNLLIQAIKQWILL